jgi:hypothetical protein
MKRTTVGLLALTFLVAFAGGATAHIDVAGSPFLLFEMVQSEIGAIDIKDGSVADWEALYDPNLVATDFFADPTVGDGAQYDPNDLDFRIWFGWTRTPTTVTPQIWFAIERVDDVYLNEYEGGNPGSLWQHDSVEFMIDGDHTGGQYGGWTSGTHYETAEELNIINNASAQQFLCIPESPDGYFAGYLGAGTGWVNTPPYMDAGGGVAGTNPTVSVIEFYATPFDNCIWNDPDGSDISDLAPDKIVGFQISVPDFETAPAVYHAFHTLSGQGETFRYSERFVDGILVENPDYDPNASAVESSSWADVKASLSN